MNAVERGFEAVREKALKWVPEGRRATWTLRTFGATKVPLLLYCMPEVVLLDDSSCVVAIPLNWRTRNHYRSMYFGALAVGADCTAGMLAMHHIDQAGGKIQLLFKDFHAEFLRRPEADVHFVCRDGAKVAQQVEEANRTGERVNSSIVLEAQVPKRNNEVAARFTMGLSLKRTALVRS